MNSKCCVITTNHSREMPQCVKNIFNCYVDYEKAFDKVRHEDLLEILKSLMLEGKDLRMIKTLYWNRRGAVSILVPRGPRGR